MIETKMSETEIRAAIKFLVMDKLHSRSEAGCPSRINCSQDLKEFFIILEASKRRGRSKTEEQPQHLRDGKDDLSVRDIQNRFK